jgi:ApaG protein
MDRYAFSVHVATAYLPDQSNDKYKQFSFAYTVTITNIGEVAAQLISRHWLITDADNSVSEVKGLGVVGAQPLLQPNESFEYTSGTVLNTEEGTMHGTYYLVAVDGTQFEATIEPFLLTVPRVLH